MGTGLTLSSYSAQGESDGGRSSSVASRIRYVLLVEASPRVSHRSSLSFVPCSSVRDTLIAREETVFVVCLAEVHCSERKTSSPAPCVPATVRAPDKDNLVLRLTWIHAANHRFRLLWYKDTDDKNITCFGKNSI